MLAHIIEVRRSLGYQRQHALHLGPHGGQHQLRIDLLIAMHQNNAQRGGYQLASRLDAHIVALANVVDVHRYGGICPNAMLLHERNEFRLGEVIGRTRLTLCESDIIDGHLGALYKRWHCLILAEGLPCHHLGESRIDQHVRRAREALDAHAQLGRGGAIL